MGPDPVSTSRQWLRDGEPIGGANGPTYTLTPDDLRTRISLRVTGAKTAYSPNTITSASTALIDPAILTATPTPTISGTLKVGNVLTATPGSWGPAPVDLKYAWFRSGTSDPVGLGATYTLAPDDLGKTMTVQVTGSKTGYASISQTSAPTATVAAGDLTSVVPTITGGPATVGNTLTANAGTWGPAPVQLTYSWFRQGVTGAVGTGQTYTPVADDLGKTLTVRVTGSKSAYTTSSRTSVPTAVTAAGTLTAPTPTVSGSPTFGVRLSANPGDWGPSPVALSYQWSRGGTPVAGATDQTYLLGLDDLNQQLTVAVTGTKAGYTGVSRASAATSAVAKATLPVPALPTISGTPAVGQSLTATSTGWGSGSVDKDYQWLRDGVVIPGRHASGPIGSSPTTAGPPSPSW